MLSSHSIPQTNSRSGLGGSVLLWLALAAPFTAIMVCYSLNHGRLLLLTRYDDLVYLVDGLKRLQMAWNTIVSYQSPRPPIVTLVRDYAATPPRSGFSSLLAFASFAIFGVHDWAPYAGNGITVIALLAVMDWLLAGLAIWQRTICLLAVLAAPMAGLFVVEFRPDFPAALLNVLFIMMVLRQPVLEMSMRQRIVAGAALGASIWIKPMVFPVTLLLGGVVVGLDLLRGLLAHGQRAWIGHIVIALAEVAAPAILIPLPHFFFGGRQTAIYIVKNVFGPNKQIWIQHSGMGNASLLTQLAWYLTGPGGMVTLGAYLLILPPLLIIGAVLALKTGSRRRPITLGCYTAMLAISYLIPAVNWQKQVFLGAVFDLLLMAGAMASMRLLFLRDRACGAVRPRWPWGAAVVLLATAAAIGGFFWPAYLGDRSDPSIVDRNQIITEIYGALRRHSPPQGTRVFLTFVGNVNQDVLEYEALQQGITGFDIRAKPASADPAVYAERYDFNELVIAADPGNPQMEVGFPSTRFLATSLEMIRARRDYALVDTFSTSAGYHYYLFAKATAPTAIHPAERPTD
jgi:hypothetical protein